MALAIGFALVSTGAMVGVARFGLPDWLPLPRASNSQPDLKLTLPPAGRNGARWPMATTFQHHRHHHQHRPEPGARCRRC
jgi:hypothetical protein